MSLQPVLAVLHPTSDDTQHDPRQHSSDHNQYSVPLWSGRTRAIKSSCRTDVRDGIVDLRGGGHDPYTAHDEDRGGRDEQPADNHLHVLILAPMPILMVE